MGSSARRWVNYIYKKAVEIYGQGSGAAGKLFADNARRSAVQQKVMSSVDYLGEHMRDVPVQLVPCFEGRLDGVDTRSQAGSWASIIPAKWGFMLAGGRAGLA